MKLQHFILTLSLILVSNSLCAQGDMSLERAIAIGLENNFGIKIDEKAILIAENNNTWARAGKVPIVNLGANSNNTFINDNNPASFLQGTFYTGSLGLSADAQWLVYAGGRVGIVKDQLELGVSQQMLAKQSNIHNLIRDIYQRYYDVIFQQEQLKVLKTNLVLSNDRYDYEKAKKEFGVSNAFNLLQFENAQIADSTNVISQLNRIEVSKRNLYNTLDILGMSQFEFPEELSVVSEEIDSEKMKEILSESNYTLKSLEMIASLNQLNTKLERTNRKPSVSLNASIGIAQNGFQIFDENPMTGEYFDFLLSNRINGSVGAVASYNVYDGGVRKTNVQNAEIQEDIDAMSILEARAELFNQLDILIENHENQRQLLSLSDKQLQLAQQNIEIAEERFKSGQITSLDFRNIQSQYVAAGFSKVSAMYNLILTKSEIDWLVGQYAE